MANDCAAAFEKPCGVPSVDDRPILNGILWVLRSGGFWSDLPNRNGPRTTVYNRFVHCRKAGVWDRFVDEIIKLYDGDVQIIDNSVVRRYQHGETAKRGARSLSRPFKRKGSPPNSRRSSTKEVDRSRSSSRGAKERHRKCPGVDRRPAESRRGLLADNRHDADQLKQAVVIRNVADLEKSPRPCASQI